jgi:hypothetical protein
MRITGRPEWRWPSGPRLAKRTQAALLGRRPAGRGCPAPLPVLAERTQPAPHAAFRRTKPPGSNPQNEPNLRVCKTQLPVLQNEATELEFAERSQRRIRRFCITNPTPLCSSKPPSPNWQNEAKRMPTKRDRQRAGGGDVLGLKEKIRPAPAGRIVCPAAQKLNLSIFSLL